VSGELKTSQVLILHRGGKSVKRPGIIRLYVVFRTRQGNALSYLSAFYITLAVNTLNQHKPWVRRPAKVLIETGNELDIWKAI
jgi:hypothetical protein